MMRSEEDADQGFDLNVEPDLGVHCSVCLDSVEIDGARSTAKLQCGHEFHLDCIGSAFNVKGVMQCPNCRNIEKGHWLYATGSANVASDFGMDSWIAEQYPFFIVPYGFRICPFRGLTEMDNPSIGGHAFYGHNDNFGEQMPPSPPGLAYFSYSRPHPHPPLNPNEHMDGPNFTPFDDSYRQNEISAPHVFPSIDAHFPTWRHHSTPSSPTDSNVIDSSHQNLRATVGELDAPTGSRLSPGHSFSSNQRPSIGTGSSSNAIVTHQNPDSSVHAFGGTQPLHPFSRNPHPAGIPLPYPPPPPSTRRSNGFRGGFPAFPPAGRAYDPRGWFYYPPYLSTSYNLQATETPIPNYFHPWGRGVHVPVLPSARDSERWLRHR